MLNIKSLIATALLSGFAVASFAQAPAVVASAKAPADKVVKVSEPKFAASAPTEAASKPRHHIGKKQEKDSKDVSFGAAK